MTKISDAYDLMILRLQTLFPDHRQIPNPYKLDENSELLLRQGYGLSISVGENTNRQVGCQMSIRRDMIVSLTRVVRANEFDVSAKDSAIKQLFEDQYLLIKDVETYPGLNSNDIVSAKYTTDNGIQFVFGEKDNYMALETTIAVEYFENLL